MWIGSLPMWPHGAMLAPLEEETRGRGKATLDAALLFGTSSER